MIEIYSDKNTKEPSTKNDQFGIQVPRPPKTPTPPKK